MKKTLTVLAALLFISFSCEAPREDNVLSIAKKLISNSKRFDKSFIILRQKQGLFDYASLRNDSVALLFNSMAFSYNNFKNLSQKFNIDSIKKANYDNDFGIITSQWSQNMINGMRIESLENNLKYRIDSTMIFNWDSCQCLKTKKICLFSDPIFSVDKMSAILGIQIFTDSLYYLNIVEMDKKKEWEITLDIASKQRLVVVKIEVNASNRLSLKPSKTIMITGWQK